MKGPKNVYTIRGLNLTVFSEKYVSCSVLFTTRRTAYIVRDNAKNVTPVGLFSKIFCEIDVVYVKSHRISC